MSIIDDTVIDNKEIILQDQLQKILPDTHRASIAVGYFFLSGFAQIVDYFEKIKSSKKDNDVIRILISPTTDKKTAEALIEGFEQLQSIKQEIERKHLQEGEQESLLENTANQIKKSMEYMEQKPGDQSVTQKFLELIASKKLKVHVYTKEKLHAKAYIFELANEQLSAVGIVGSSNLSIAGISAHSELNIKTRDPRDATKLLEWFDSHWNDSVPFTNEIADILHHSWAGLQRTSKEVYEKAILHEHAGKFDIEKRKAITRKNQIKLFDFQTAAVIDALSALDKYDGVIISDVVGLGKTFVGSTILRFLQEKDRLYSLIICPPHLISMWEKFKEDNQLDAEILSRGKLGRKKHILSKYINTRGLVLVDESHNFRNHLTNSYQELSDFMYASQAKIVLMTATPLANKLYDIKNQLKLFPGGDETNIPTGTDNTSLDTFFKLLKKDDDGSINPELHKFLKHVMVRRTRKYIVEHHAQKDENGRDYLKVDNIKKFFPKRKLEKPIRYNIDKVYRFAYEEIESKISVDNLFLARYNSGHYVLDEYKLEKNYADLIIASGSMVPLIRISLLKRMDSSIQAFSDSIRNYIRGFKIFLNDLENGKVSIGEDSADEIFSMIHDENYDELEKYETESESPYEIEKFNVVQMKADIKHDLVVFEKIREYLNHEFSEFDDKLHKLESLIRDNMGKKILVFTESVSTAKYISNYLQETIPGMTDNLESVYSNTSNKIDAIKRFDPLNNGDGSDLPKSEQIFVLVSTDVLSEGVNLQRGEIIINYDFHWNPVKLIQRVGRIDRIGSENETIRIINFMPDLKLEANLGLVKSVEKKIERIHNVIGQDYQILKSDEKLNEKSMYAVYGSQDDTILDDDDKMLLSFEPSDFEKDVSHMSDKDRTRVENIPYGIRCTVPGDTLLIACEAEHWVGKTLLPSFRKYYKVNSNGSILQISADVLLGSMKANSGISSVDQQYSKYNDLVTIAREKFNGDMIKKSRQEISSKGVPVDLVQNLNRIIQKRTVSDNMLSKLHNFLNRPVYDSTLSSIFKKLKTDVRSGMIDSDFIDELKSIYYIHDNANNVVPKRMLKRPRILYSMVVRHE